MKSHHLLRKKLMELDGRDYGGYQRLKGGWSFPGFEFHIDKIPKDPHAPPHTGVYRASIPRRAAGFPASMTASPVLRRALCDFLTREVHRNCLALCGGRRGAGNSGVITIAEPGQAILERTSVVAEGEVIEARMFLGLPAAGRSIRAELAATMLFEELPSIVRSSLFLDHLDPHRLQRHLATAEDSDFLRNGLAARGLVAFIADGALLPRASGVDPRPLEAPAVIPFKTPESLRVRFDLPHAGAITGMGIPAGVTLIVGGGYHGKSTLLQALELGIYDHIPGDGREYCVSLPETQKIRATNGRSVVGTDISAFIGDIPLAGPTASFSTLNASGSTSQAAFAAEAMEVGARVLLMYEDTSATNFMIRDKRMQELVAKRHEPVTAFVDKVKQLHQQHGISAILVMGGSGDYFDVAGRVIQMTRFEPRDVTERAWEIAARCKTERIPEGGTSFAAPSPRHPLPDGIDPHNAYGHFRITASHPHRLTFGRECVDLSDVEQIVEAAQTRAIGWAIQRARGYMDGKATLREISHRIKLDIERGGLDALDPALTGNLAQFRSLDFAAALNRMRSLQVKQAS